MRCPPRAELLSWFKGPVAPPRPPAAEWCSEEAAGAQAAQHPRPLLPEDLTAATALDAASSGLLYLDDHGAVCTGAQLELVVTLCAQHGET